ncbi:RINT1-like protein [Contarinia nasturtii]|uniref:RINT1-like protein n=1 Tax=Contarinia nasturtii TaxID=265458 RepID=UPI0012D44C7D|nr:RINT1-like protein [Contarinia nasturtii]
MKDVAKSVIERINRDIGSDIKNLHNCKAISSEYAKRVGEIEAELLIEGNGIPSTIKSALAQCRDSNEIIQLETAKIDQFQEKLIQKLDGYHSILDGVTKQLDKIRCLQLLVEYFKILNDIQEIGKSLAANIKDDQKAIGLYLSLYGGTDSANSIIGRLESVEAVNLRSYAERTAIYWYEILKKKLSKDFESVLDVIKWPYLGSASTELINPTKDSLNKLMSAAEHLFLLQSPEEKNDSFISITPSILCQPLSTPVELLVKPFRQRFLYHFTGPRQTNRPDKPEWFFTQILNWAKDNHIFVGTHIQPALNLAGHSDINIRLEFVRGLVQLAVEKLCNDIDEIVENDALFSHLIDETLAFEQEIRDTLGYPSSYCSAITVLTQAKYLTKWLAIEEQFTSDKMDLILSQSSAWLFIDPSNLEELKIPRCADQFIRLLDAICERYCNLPQPGHQLQFLNLQLELIENFRRRLVHLHSNPENGVTTTCMVLNAINYINSVLREWGENVHYLHLYAALFGPHTDEINSVFDKVVDDLEQWQRILVKELTSKLVDDIKAKSMAYRHDNWISMSDHNALEPFMLSSTAGEMFQLMVTSLHNLETELSINIFNIALRLIAHQLDDFFIDSMIMNTKFSTGGASQFDFDMNRNLFALFGQYARRPDLLFKKIHDACKLLVFPLGNAMLLTETLKNDIKSKSDSKGALAEIGVVNISNLMALDILERRNDICSY